MTIHLHTKHFSELPLSLPEYIILIMHEDRQASIEQMKEATKLSDRAVMRTRLSLVDMGYLTREGNITNFKYALTEKAYL